MVVACSIRIDSGIFRNRRRSRRSEKRPSRPTHTERLQELFADRQTRRTRLMSRISAINNSGSAPPLYNNGRFANTRTAAHSYGFNNSRRGSIAGAGLGNTGRGGRGTDSQGLCLARVRTSGDAQNSAIWDAERDEFRYFGTRYAV